MAIGSASLQLRRVIEAELLSLSWEIPVEKEGDHTQVGPLKVCILPSWAWIVTNFGCTLLFVTPLFSLYFNLSGLRYEGLQDQYKNNIKLFLFLRDLEKYFESPACLGMLSMSWDLNTETTVQADFEWHMFRAWSFGFCFTCDISWGLSCHGGLVFLSLSLQELSSPAKVSTSLLSFWLRSISIWRVLTVLRINSSLY